MRTVLLLLILAVPGAESATTDKPVVAIIGTGTLAGTLGPALGRSGYPVIYGSRETARAWSRGRGSILPSARDF